MAPLISNNQTKPVTVISIVTHLNAERHFPAAKDLDVGLVKAWMRAVNIGLSNQAVKMLAPKVLEELFVMEDVNVKDVAIYQQRHPVKRIAPIVTHFWSGGSPPAQKSKHELIKLEDAPISNRVYKFLAKKNATIKEEIDHGTTRDVYQESGSEVEGDRLLELADNAMNVISDEAAKELKKAKKAAKKARKLIKSLEKALPPVGKVGIEDEDNGNDSDWSQSSWNPSWASDEEESEEL